MRAALSEDRYPGEVGMMTLGQAQVAGCWMRYAGHSRLPGSTSSRDQIIHQLRQLVAIASQKFFLVRMEDRRLESLRDSTRPLAQRTPTYPAPELVVVARTLDYSNPIVRFRSLVTEGIASMDPDPTHREQTGI